MEKKELKEMSFMNHLEDLRWLLVRSTIAVLIFASACYFIDDFIFDTIIFGPKEPTFVTYEFFCKLSKFFGIDNPTACATSFSFIIQNTEVGGQFSMYLWTMITAGFIIAFSIVVIMAYSNKAISVKNKSFDGIDSATNSFNIPK